MKNRSKTPPPQTRKTDPRKRSNIARKKKKRRGRRAQPPDGVDTSGWDFNEDGEINSMDLFEMIDYQCGATDKDGAFMEAYDFDGSGVIDQDDIALMEAANGVSGCGCIDDPSCPP